MKLESQNQVRSSTINKPIIFAGESFPRPVFRWLEDEKPREANRTEVAAGKYSGGEVVTSIVEFRAQPEHNGKVYQCFAHNPTFFDKMQPEELNVTIRLEVLCKYLTPMHSFFTLFT